MASPASAGTVDRLLRAGCPPYEALVTRESYTSQEQANALAGNFVIRKQTVHLVPPVNWKQDPVDSTGFRSDLQRLAWLDVLFYTYRHADSRERSLDALTDARALVLDWLDAASNRNRGVHSQAWINKVIGDRAPYIAYLARAAACEDVLTRSKARTLLRSLKDHAGRLVSGTYKVNNHRLYVDLGLGLIADYLPWLSRADEWRALAKRRFVRTLEAGVRDGGVWFEPATDYQLLVTRLVEKFYDYLARSSRPIRRKRRALRRTVGRFTMPDGNLTQIGDSNLTPAPDWAVDMANNQNGLFGMRNAGYAVVRAGDSYLAVGASFHTRFHKLSDDLSFQLFESGHRVAGDGGRYHSDRDAWREFAVSARSHSVLTVGNRDFSRSQHHRYGSGILATGAGDGWYAILGRNPLVGRSGVNHKRLFLYRPGEVLVVLDQARSTRSHGYTRYLQLGPDVQLADLPEPDGHLLSLRAPGPIGTLFDAPLPRGGPVSLGRIRGQESPPRGWTFPDFRVRVPRWMVILDDRREDANYASTFSFGPESPTRANPTRTRWKVRLRDPAGNTYFVRAKRHGSKLSVDRRAG